MNFGDASMSTAVKESRGKRKARLISPGPLEVFVVKDRTSKAAADFERMTEPGTHQA
jgi:hypothetical protein